MAKALLKVTSDDIYSAVGSHQLCVGHVDGCEAGVHSMRTVYDDPTTETVVFNSLNREAALRNVEVLCPLLAPFLINTYQNDDPMYIDGDVIFFKEGVTQGDPLAMPLYALASMPHFHME